MDRELDDFGACYCVCGAIGGLHDIGCPMETPILEKNRALRKARALKDLAQRNAGAVVPNTLRDVAGGTLIRSRDIRVPAGTTSVIEWTSQIPIRGPYLLDIEFTELGPSEPDREHLLQSFAVESFMLGNTCLFGTTGPFPARQVFGTTYRGEPTSCGQFFRVQLKTGAYGFSCYLTVKSGLQHPENSPKKFSNEYDVVAYRPERLQIPGDIAFDQPFHLPPAKEVYRPDREIVPSNLFSEPIVHALPAPAETVDPKRLEHEHRVSVDRCHTQAHLDRLAEDPFADIDPDDP